MTGYNGYKIPKLPSENKAGQVSQGPTRFNRNLFVFSGQTISALSKVSATENGKYTDVKTDVLALMEKVKKS
ncbi:hypothetical protein [Desulfitobacterium sp. AusDCA]|uniref:hypothetical protein n=1 Tax=Desulfitobacterium sp. AusDCA TaxID=3240383 RepID=UPI003DA70E3F